MKRLLNKCPTITHENNAPANLWGFALRYSALILNYSPIRSNDWMSPYELVLEKSQTTSAFILFIALDYIMCIKKKDQTLLFLTIKQNPVTFLAISKKVQ